MKKLFLIQKNTNNQIGIIKTIVNKDINEVIIMLPNFTGEYPIIGGDNVKNSDFGINTPRSGISNFTKMLSKNFQKEIIQINYCNDGNFKDFFNLILKYLKESNYQNKKISIYGQSMGGKVALYLTYYLLKNGYIVNDVIVNSAVINKSTIANPLSKLSSYVLAAFYMTLRIIPNKKLVGIISASNKDLDIEINKSELIKIVETIKGKNIKYKQLKTRIDFIKKDFNSEIINTINNSKTKIYVIRSIPTINSKDDGIINHCFLEKLKNMFGKKINYIDVKSWHSQVAEKNNLYANALKKIYKNNQ